MATKQFIKPEPDSQYALKPCPFCGSDEVSYEEYYHVSGTRWRCVCLKCMAMVDPGYAQNRHVVQAMWNRRA